MGTISNNLLKVGVYSFFGSAKRTPRKNRSQSVDTLLTQSTYGSTRNKNFIPRLDANGE